MLDVLYEYLPRDGWAYIFTPEDGPCEASTHVKIKSRVGGGKTRTVLTQPQLDKAFPRLNDIAVAHGYHDQRHAIVPRAGSVFMRFASGTEDLITFTTLTDSGTGLRGETGCMRVDWNTNNRDPIYPPLGPTTAPTSTNPTTPTN